MKQFAFCILFLLLLCSSVSAVPYVYSFSGTITNLSNMHSDDPLIPLDNVGDVFTGFFYYDVSLAEPTIGTSAFYLPEEIQLGFSFFFKSFSYSYTYLDLSQEAMILQQRRHSESDALYIGPPGGYNFAPDTFAEFYLWFRDHTCTVFDGGHANYQLDPTDFDEVYFTMNIYTERYGLNHSGLRGQIDHIAVTPPLDTTPVPEPSTFALLVIGMVLIFLNRKRIT